jgi:hypothetical protein
MSLAWQIVSDVSGGTAKMRAAGETYLPREPAEKPEAYSRRLKRSVFFNAYSRTRDALVGMVFKNDPKLGDQGDDQVSDEIKNDLENIDLAGSHFDVFAKELFTDAFEGHVFILVDMQPALPAGSTRADERATGRRPYWVKYKAKHALNWRTEIVNGETILSQITFEEITNESKGDYGEESVCRYRVFRLNSGIVTWALYRKQKTEGSPEETFTEEGSGEVNGLDRIPVAVVYGNREGLLQSSPPLLDLAYLNIAHWQEYSDYRNILHVAQVPILVRKGATPDQQAVEVGVGSTVDVPNEGDLKWCEHTGKAIESGRTELQDLEQRMALMGLSMLSQKSDSNVTATEIRANNLQESSDLATMARSLQDALELALEFHAQYLNLGSGGSIKLGVAESDLTLDGSTITALVTAVNSQPPLLTAETFLGILARGFPGVELQDEIAKLKAMPGFGQAPPTPQDILKMKGGVSKILTPPAAPGPTGAQ